MARLVCSVFCVCLSLLFAQAQGLKRLPANLTSSRSVVIISVPTSGYQGQEIRGNWRKVVEKAHGAFRKIGIDGIYYLPEADFFGGPEVTQKLLALFASRQVQNLIFITESGGQYQEVYEIKIIPFTGSHVSKVQPGYQISGPDFDNQLLSLGRTVLREQLERTNFLIPDDPEYIQELKLYTGTRFENYPGRLKGLKLAVVKFPEIPVQKEWDDQTKSAVDTENQQIKDQNLKLERFFSTYPYPYELVNYTGDGDLYKLGFQYALIPICSTGKNIRQTLNYKLKASETNYITAVSAETGLKMETISSNSEVCKYYIKQTIAGDIHVGSRWDADTDWATALDNFIQNLTSELK